MNSIEKLVPKCTLKMVGGKVYLKGQEIVPPLPFDLLEEYKAKPDKFFVVEGNIKLAEKFEAAKKQRRVPVNKKTDPIMKWKFLSKEPRAGFQAFKDFIQERLDQIRELPEADKVKVIEKWRRLYPDEECPV